MKLNVELLGKDSVVVAIPRGGSVRRSSGPGVRRKAVIPKRFRRLKWNEVVTSGDFVANERQRLELWKGPSGFRADAFVRPIYRATKAIQAQPKKRK